MRDDSNDPVQTPRDPHPLALSPGHPVTRSLRHRLTPSFNGAARTKGGSWQRIASVARKECLHIVRDRATLMIMLGYAIDTNVRFIPTVVLDQSKTQQSRQLLQSFENSEDFKVVARVRTE